MATLKITTDRTPEGVLVALDGDGDVAAAPILEREFTRLSGLKPKLVVIDAGNLTFISSLVIGQLLGFQQTMTRAKGRLIIAAAQPMVKDALSRAKLQDSFTFHDNAWAALAAG